MITIPGQYDERGRGQTSSDERKPSRWQCRITFPSSVYGACRFMLAVALLAVVPRGSTLLLGRALSAPYDREASFPEMLTTCAKGTSSRPGGEAWAWDWALIQKRFASASASPGSGLVSAKHSAARFCPQLLRATVMPHALAASD